MTSSYIPSLAEKLTISPFDEDFYLVCIEQDEPVKLKITQSTKLLIEQIDGIRPIDEITHAFNKISGAQLPADTIIKIIKDQLQGFGLLKGDLNEKIRVKDNYLKLRMNIFPHGLVRSLVAPILFLFTASVFKWVICCCLVFLSVGFFCTIHLKLFYAHLSVHFASWFIALNIFGIILHELGHAGACEKYGAKTGAIGFGFYLLTPVFYTDVSDAWRLKKSERLIVDLAGIYMQLIFCSLLLLLYFISGNAFCLYASFLISTTVIITLNPLLRYDGYWAVTDLLNVTNLRENSHRILNQFIRRMLKKHNTWIASWKNVFLAIYAVTSSAFIFYFVTVLILYQRSSILNFPVNAFHFVSRLATGFPHITFEWLKLSLSGLFLPFIFYVFLFRTIKQKIHLIKRPRS